MATVPKFSELKKSEDTGQPLSWGVWGKDDQLGTLNFITPEATVAAAKCVRRGVRFNLDLPLHIPYSLLTAGGFLNRQPPKHTLEGQDYRTLYIRDDKLDGFYLQGSTQWDGLTHIGSPQIGFYNGVKPEQITFEEDTRLGIEHVADFGVVTRGILVDFDRYFKKTGREWNPTTGDRISADEVEACLKDQGVTLTQGDILCFRYGWTVALFAEQDDKVRNSWFADGTFSGIAGDQKMWELIWDNGVAALAADSPTMEASPMIKLDNMHQAIPRLGLTIGEMFFLEDWADDSAKDGVYAAMFTSSPLNVRGGVGSPPNAIAVK